MMLEATCKIPFAEVYEKLQMLIDQGQFELLSDDLVQLKDQYQQNQNHFYSHS